MTKIYQTQAVKELAININNLEHFKYNCIGPCVSSNCAFSKVSLLYRYISWKGCDTYTPNTAGFSGKKVTLEDVRNKEKTPERAIYKNSSEKCWTKNKKRTKKNSFVVSHITSYSSSGFAITFPEKNIRLIQDRHILHFYLLALMFWVNMQLQFRGLKRLKELIDLIRLILLILQTFQNPKRNPTI